jgi:hypothetical protein
MAEYTVTTIVDATQTVTVQFDDKGMTPEQIKERAEELAGEHPDAGVTLCFQCADELEVGDPQNTVAILRDGQQFWDDMRGYQS